MRDSKGERRGVRSARDREKEREWDTERRAREREARVQVGRDKEMEKFKGKRKEGQGRDLSPERHSALRLAYVGSVRSGCVHVYLHVCGCERGWCA